MASRSLATFLALFLSFTAHGENAPLASWAEKIQAFGDIRFRHDYISRSRAIDTAERHRERLRLRVGFQAQVTETVKTKVRLASGEGNDPISTNQSLGDNGSKKPINIDLAMIDWKLGTSTNLVLGKMDNPLRPIGASQLIYDVDYTPEGIALGNKFGPFFINLGGFTIQERAPQSANGQSEPDSWLLAGLFGYKGELSSNLGLLATAGYHNFTAIKKNGPLKGSATTPPTDFFGNSNAGGVYSRDYQLGEVGAELTWKMSSSQLSVYFDMINNFYVEENNVSMMSGIQWQTLTVDGKPRWTFAYAYMDSQRDATLSAVNNSDWGNGIDGGYGHMGLISYAINANTSVGGTWYQMEVGGNSGGFTTQRGLADLVLTF